MYIKLNIANTSGETCRVSRLGIFHSASGSLLAGLFRSTNWLTGIRAGSCSFCFPPEGGPLPATRTFTDSADGNRKSSSSGTPLQTDPYPWAGRPLRGEPAVSLPMSGFAWPSPEALPVWHLMPELCAELKLL